jgi:hypothetical protein
LVTGGSGVLGRATIPPLRAQGHEIDTPARTAQELVRIVQEALTNALKHSNPTRVTVTLSFRDSRLEVEIIDDAAEQPERSDATTGHGIVGNGWYFRDLGEIFLWRQHNKLVQGEKVWETARRAKPGSAARETARAVFDILEIPVWGREEHAADRTAGFIMFQFGDKIAYRTLVGTSWFLAQSSVAIGGMPTGDFSYVRGLDGEVDGSMLLDSIEECYFGFRRRIRGIEHSTSCT